jgi:hypothetical protein
VRQVRRLIFPAICLVLAACGGSNQQTQNPTSTVPEAALGRLLLLPAEVSMATGAARMTVTGAYDKVGDHSAAVSDKNCLVMYGPGEPAAYAGSGATATRAQFLKDAADPLQTKHTVFQTVVSFPSADQAAAFFTESAKRWSACSNLRYTITLPAGAMTWDVGPVSNTDGTLSATETREGGNGWACQRALTASNNVAIDVTACSYGQTDSAVGIAHEIAAKAANRLVGPAF